MNERQWGWLEPSDKRIGGNIYREVLKRNFRLHHGEVIAEQLLPALVHHQLPIQFCKFWGVGDKISRDSKDIVHLNADTKLRDFIRYHHQAGIIITFILSDVHGYDMNRSGKTPYLDEIDQEIKERGFESVLLSNLYRQWSISLPPFERINDSDIEAMWKSLGEEIQRQLIKAASKHNKTGKQPIDAAKYYCMVRWQERIHLSKFLYPNGIDQSPFDLKNPQSCREIKLMIVDSSKELGLPLMPEGIPLLFDESKNGPPWFNKGHEWND